MLVRKSSIIWLIAMYATIALTLPYEWRVGLLGSLMSTSVAAVITIITYVLCQVQSKLMAVLIGYNAILLLSTYLNGNELYDQIVLCMMGISLAGAFELVNKYASKRQYETYMFYFLLLVVINALQTIYFGGARGSNKEYVCIFGDKNWYLYKILPAIFLLFAWCAKYEKPLLSVEFSIIWALSFASVLIAQSGTGTLVLGLLGIYILLIPIIKKIKQNKDFDNYIVYSFVILLVFFIIVVWNATEIFAPIIVGVFGKDLTLSTRTRIWGRALELIAQKPILGYGAIESNDFVSLFYGIPEFTTTHNQYLGELFRGGIPLLACFVLMVYLAFKRIQNSENIDVAKAMTFGIFCLLLWWMMESISSMYLILVLFICYHLPDDNLAVEGWDSLGGD